MFKQIVSSFALGFVLVTCAVASEGPVHAKPVVKLKASSSAMKPMASHTKGVHGGRAAGSPKKQTGSCCGMSCCGSGCCGAGCCG